METVRINLVLRKELDQRLRVAVAQRLGGRKGDLSIAVNQAIEMWIVRDDDVLNELYFQATSVSHKQKEREDAARLLAKKGKRSNPGLTERLLLRISGDSSFSRSERDNARKLYNNIVD